MASFTNCKTHTLSSTNQARWISPSLTSSVISSSSRHTFNEECDEEVRYFQEMVRRTGWKSIGDWDAFRFGISWQLEVHKMSEKGKNADESAVKIGSKTDEMLFEQFKKTVEVISTDEGGLAVSDATEKILKQFFTLRKKSTLRADGPALEPVTTIKPVSKENAFTGGVPTMVNAKLVGANFMESSGNPSAPYDFVTTKRPSTMIDAAIRNKICSNCGDRRDYWKQNPKTKRQLKPRERGLARNLHDNDNKWCHCSFSCARCGKSHRNQGLHCQENITKGQKKWWDDTLKYAGCTIGCTIALSSTKDSEPQRKSKRVRKRSSRKIYESDSDDDALKDEELRENPPINKDNKDAKREKGANAKRKRADETFSMEDLKKKASWVQQGTKEEMTISALQLDFGGGSTKKKKSPAGLRRSRKSKSTTSRSKTVKGFMKIKDDEGNKNDDGCGEKDSNDDEVKFLKTTPSTNPNYFSNITKGNIDKCAAFYSVQPTWSQCGGWETYTGRHEELPKPTTNPDFQRIKQKFSIHVHVVDFWKGSVIPDRLKEWVEAQSCQVIVMKEFI